MNQTVRFWDRIAARYSRQPVADEAAYQKKLQVTREYFRPDMQVLEFGCGTGSTAIVHAPYVSHILALDISSKMLEIAQGTADAKGVKNITFKCAAIDDFAVPDQSLDAVLALNILHLLDDRTAVIARVHRMLKPGGVFVSSTACLGDSMKFFKFVAPIGKFLGLLPQVRVFSIAQLVGSLTDAGFEIEHQWQPGKNKGVFIVARKAQ